ncbi:uncharacterized protein BYT42DRAFT_300302 [Radiomyces spectabilis]|uniref:uncharacterized protein n=1 Tax=Radiomyces spectabilis TaxID=64574 RepID=UPI002220D978|nr:uncharacterized protein BYT42DRAFT_300302 [Radiomyces spectabilis]KAI8381293.1 hypothetical protein BYT42DRAFT_300302 [Radiomyces spectabilis]
MTRYTKLQRKTHEKASGFNVTPLLPAKSNDEGGNNSDAPNRNNRKRGFTNDNTGTKSEKALREIEKRKKRKQMSKDKNTICFGCRQKGHSVGNCPKAKQSAQGICYNCGSSEHSLKNCKKPRKGSKYKSGQQKENHRGTPE